MSPRVVISFRGAVPADAEGGERYLARALAMKQRAEAHGATLCAWSAWTFSFCFEPDELEEAVTLATSVFEDESASLCAGIAEGDLRPVGERGTLAGLAWGLPLVSAVALSRAARGGEVLVDEPFCARHGAALAALGLRAQGDHLKRLVPLSPSIAPEPPPSLLGIEPEPPLAPTSLRTADLVGESAKRALLQGDVPALERLIAELQGTGEHVELVERMSGFAALRRGATADALRRLRAAAEAVKQPAQRARARLAYGVALASAGRTDAALLEVLEALARAREAEDSNGEHACALFLARLSAAGGHPDAASVWARLAAKAG
jgi:hypothetical protein